MEKSKNYQLQEHLQVVESAETQEAIRIHYPDGTSITARDTIAYPTTLSHVRAPYLESATKGSIEEHLRKMSAYPSLDYEGGFLSREEFNNIQNQKARERKELSGFLEEELTKEGSIVGHPYEWMIAYLPAGPYTDTGLHVTLIANPKSLDDSPIYAFHSLSEKHQHEFLETTLLLQNWMQAKYPDQEFAMGVNRGWPKWYGDVAHTPQTIQSIHSHIFALPKDKVSFDELYTPAATEPEQIRLNNKALTHRLSRRVLAVHNMLVEDLTESNAGINVQNEGDLVAVQLDPSNLSSTENCMKISTMTQYAEVILAMDSMQNKTTLGYSWTITSDGLFKIAFTENGHGSLEAFHNGILDRGVTETALLEKVANGQRDLKEELPKLLQG